MIDIVREDIGAVGVREEDADGKRCSGATPNGTRRKQKKNIKRH